MFSFTRSLIFSVLICTSFLLADSTDVKYYSEQDWGLGGVFRTASIPFDTQKDDYVGTFIPLLRFENERFFLHGMEGGVKLYTTDNWRFSGVGRRHFFDIPEEFQNIVQGDNVDFGPQVRYTFYDQFYLDWELMVDLELKTSSNIRAGYHIENYPFSLDAYGLLKFKSSDYNSYYFGLDSVRVKGGIDLLVGVVLKFHVLSNLYLYGAGSFTRLDNKVRNVSWIKDDYTWQVFFGLGFSNDKSKPKRQKIKNKAYVRLAQGLATPTDLTMILKMQSRVDKYSNKLTSFFYGYPLTDSFLGLPFDIYVTTGFIWHWENDQEIRDENDQPIPGTKVQDRAWEVVLAVKGYYEIPLPWRLRVGFAEGFSYASKVPYIERAELDKKDQQYSNFLNYLDVSLDINIGDIFGNKPLKDLWLGWSLHHRSGIWGNAQQYSRIDGGSNYNTLYLQWHF